MPQLTVALTVVSFIAGIVIGLLVAFMRDSRLRIVRAIAWSYVWIFRGIPTLIQLFIVWYALPQLFPVFSESWFVPFLAETICPGLQRGRRRGRDLRGGLLAVDDGPAAGGSRPGHATGEGLPGGSSHPS